TVRTVVWEDGGGDSASVPISWSGGAHASLRAVRGHPGCVFSSRPRQAARLSVTIPFAHNTEIMRFALLPKALAGCLFLAVFIAGASAQPRRSRKDSLMTSPGVLLQIIRAEDERRWDNTLPVFLLGKNPN